MSRLLYIEELRDKLFSAFIKSCIDSGAHTLKSLKEKDADVMEEAFTYWVKNLPDQDISTPKI